MALAFARAFCYDWTVTSLADAGDIEGAQRLTDIFGKRPSFHDAEILTRRLDRGRAGPSLEIQIHVFLMTGSLDDRGHYILRYHTLATLRFSGIEMLELEDFKHQNVIDPMGPQSCDSVPSISMEVSGDRFGSWSIAARDRWPYGFARTL